VLEHGPEGGSRHYTAKWLIRQQKCKQNRQNGEAAVFGTQKHLRIRSLALLWVVASVAAWADQKRMKNRCMASGTTSLLHGTAWVRLLGKNLFMVCCTSAIPR